MPRFFKSKHHGFSLVEMLVSLGIVSVILTVILLNQSSYSDAAALGNLADEIGLTISQAQAYGIAVKELTAGSDDFSASYGLSVSLLASGSNSDYLFFADRNSNHAYDGTWACVLGGASECLAKKTFSRGNYIDDLCVINIANTEDCSGVGRVDVSFVRPNPQAAITFFDNGGSTYTPSEMKGFKIKLKSPVGNSRSVTVYQSGQISTQ